MTIQKENRLVVFSKDKKNKDPYISASWILIILGIIIFFYFLIKLKSNNNLIFWGELPINDEISSHIGDFVGGVVGTIFALAGNLLLYYTFKSNRNSNANSALSNNISSVIFNQKIIFEKDFETAIFYSEFGFKEFLNYDLDLKKIEIKDNSIYKKTRDNSNHFHLDLYNEYLAVIRFLIEKRYPDNEFILTPDEKNIFYLLVKINFHVGRMRDFLKNAQESYPSDFKYNNIINSLDFIHEKGEKAYLDYNKIFSKK